PAPCTRSSRRSSRICRSRASTTAARCSRSSTAASCWRPSRCWRWRRRCASPGFNGSPDHALRQPPCPVAAAGRSGRGAGLRPRLRDAAPPPGSARRSGARRADGGDRVGAAQGGARGAGGDVVRSARAGAGPAASGGAGAGGAAAGARPGGGARLFAIDAGQGRLPFAPRAGQARARAAAGHARRRPGRRGGVRRREPDLSAHHRLRGGEAVLARSRPLGHAGRRDGHRPRHQERARAADGAAVEGRRHARAGDPAPHRRRGHRQRAAGGCRGGVQAGRQDLHRRHRVALGRAHPRIRRAGEGDRLREGRRRALRDLAPRRGDANRDRPQDGRRLLPRGQQAVRRGGGRAGLERAQADRERGARGARVRRDLRVLVVAGVPAAGRRGLHERAPAAPPVGCRGGRVRRLETFVAVLGFAPLLLGFGLLEKRDPEIEAGNAALKAGKADEALTHYDQAVKKLPGDSGAHFDRGAALYALSRFDEAGQEFLRATEAKDPALKASAFYNLGNAYFKKEKFKDAVSAYTRTLGLKPDDKPAKWNLEIALRKQKDEDEKKDQKKQDDQNKKDKKDDQKKDDKKDKKDQDKKDEKDQKKKDQSEQKQNQ